MLNETVTVGTKGYRDIQCLSITKTRPSVKKTSSRICFSRFQPALIKAGKINCVQMSLSERSFFEVI